MLISVQMALQSLNDQVDIVKAAEDNVKRERAVRDDLIRDALSNGVTYREVGRRTGLSRDRLNTIASLPSSGV